MKWVKKPYRRGPKAEREQPEPQKGRCDASKVMRTLLPRHFLSAIFFQGLGES